MKNLFIAFIMAVVVSTMAFASVNILSDGTNLGPAQDINIIGGTVSGNGEVKTVDFTAIADDLSVSGKIEADGTIYTATIQADGAIYPGYATLDPCTTLGRGYIFISSAGMPCFCNAVGTDLSIYDGSSACAY